MALEPIYHLTPKHLSPRPVNSILLAWHGELDVQAIRIYDLGKATDEEQLWVNGKRVNLDPVNHFRPTQQVINLAALGKRDAAKRVAMLLNL